MSDHGITISQQELQEIYELDRDIAQKEERVGHLKSNVKALLMEKIPIEPGRFHPRLAWRTMFHPAWKQLVIDKLGIAVAEAFRRSSPKNRVCELLVEEHATLPLWKQNSGMSDSQG
jgi:hypothetical protein